MVQSILGSALQSAWGAGGTTSPERTPSVSPGLDPGRYAFDLWFNKKRREEEQRNLDRAFTENQRQFNEKMGLDQLATMSRVNNEGRQLGMSGIEMLANNRVRAQQAARQQAFARDLLNAARG